MEHIFLEISLVLIVGTLCATIAKFFRQPMIPAYILAGVLLGPFAFNVITSGELLETLSTFGIAFLLFLVGIELDLRKFLKTGKAAITIGIAQMAFAVGVGYLIISALGFHNTEAFFLAIALGFSSTIVGLKLIGERKELDTVYGQIVIGLMLTQDFIAVLILIFFDVITGGASAGGTLFSDVGITVIKGFFLIGVSLLASKYVLLPVFRYFAKTAELLFLGAICWCLVLAIMASLMGFSIEVGSLIAGVSLSFLPYNYEISYRIRSLRDFFLPIFFAVLGGQLIFSSGADVLVPAVTLSAFVLFASPILVALCLLWFGYRSHTSFQAATAIGQVSEFSFILMALGFSNGIIDQNIVSLVALIGLITMTISTYMIEYNDVLYKPFRPLLKKLQRSTKNSIEDHAPKTLQKHVVVFGYNVLGKGTYAIMKKMKKDIIIIDHNPDKTEELVDNDIPHLYGSMSDDEVLEKARMNTAEYVISTVRSHRDTLDLLSYVKNSKLKAKVIVTAFYAEDALDYYAAGAHFVLMPTSVSTQYLQDILGKSMTRKRNAHLKELKAMVS